MWREVESSVDRSLECDRFFNLNLAAGSLTWTLHQQLGPNLTKNTIRLSLQTRFHCNNRISPFMSSHEFDWVGFFVCFFSRQQCLVHDVCNCCQLQYLWLPLYWCSPLPPPTQLAPKTGSNPEILLNHFPTQINKPRMILTLLIDREWPLKMVRCIGIMGFLSWRNLWFHGGRKKFTQRVGKGKV